MEQICTWRNTLETALKDKGMSKRALSKAIGKDPSYVGKILNGTTGKAHQPGFEVMQDICRVMDIPIERMLSK